MAGKKRKKKTLNKKSRLMSSRSRYRRGRGFSLDIDAGIAKEIWGVFYLALGVLTIMSLQGGLGIVGDLWRESLLPIFGYGIYLLPAVLIGIALALFFAKQIEFGLAKMLGVVLFVSSVLGTIHLSVPEYDIYAAAMAGEYGGMVGFVASFLFRLVLGVKGAYVVLLAVFLVSILLTFEISLVRAFGAFKWMFSGFAKVFVSSKTVRKKSEKLVESEKDLNKAGGLAELNIVKPVIEKEEDTVLLRQASQDDDEAEFVPDEGFVESGVSPQDIVSANSFIVMEMDYEWEFPPLDLLNDAVLTIESNDAYLKKNAAMIRNKLLQFGIDVTMHDVHVGPTVMQYTLRPHDGVKLSKITSLKNDLALALAAKAVRIEAPIPGKSLVGIEIPNDIRSTVHLREMLESKEMKEYSGQIKLPLGRDVTGAPVIGSLEKMPHLLIAGATGAGKSVGINSILLSFFYQFSPKDLKLILIDPKRVELSSYNSVPHLLTPVITDVEKAAIALRWAVKEMTRRYQICAESGHRNIDDYNADKEIREKMPKIVIIVDELADLMMTAGKEVEASICRLAQMARAVGMHLIIATQRPSVDVVTGLIKANIPARIAFTMSSSVDSRTVLDMIGAEDLLGHGDMLFMPGNMSRPIRVQGVFVSSNEIEKVTNKLKIMPGLRYDDTVVSELVAEEKVQGLPDSVLVQNDNGFEDDLYQSALRLVLDQRKASASLLQRRLSIGYARAARLLDQMEENGVIGPACGAKPREIYGGESVQMQ